MSDPVNEQNDTPPEEEVTTEASVEEVEASPGVMLRELREAKGLSQASVAESLHMTVHYVNALEEDNYQKLPGRTFVKGYFRSYANLLGADTEAVLACYDQYSVGREVVSEQVIEARRKRRNHDQSIFWLTTAGIIIVLVIALSWWFYGRESGSRSVISVAPRSPVSALGSSESQRATRADTRVQQATGSNVSPAPDTTAEAMADVDLAEQGVAATELDDSAAMESPALEQDAVPAAEEGFVPATVDEGASESAQETIDSQNTDPETSQPETTEAESAEPEATEPETSESEPVARVIEETQGEDGRIILLTTEGDDLLAIRMRGQSWIEIDNAEEMRLFNDILSAGDQLTVQSVAPFSVLLGDARQAEITFNDAPVNLSPRIRSDNTARIILEP